MSFQFQTFSLLLYLLESSVIGDLRRYYCRCFGGRDVPTESIWYSELSKCVCFDCSTNLPFPISISLLGPPYFLKHSNIEIKPINNPKMTSKCSSERRSHLTCKLYRCLLLRNCYSHPSVQQPQPWLVSSHQQRGYTLHPLKITRTEGSDDDKQ